MAGLQAGAVRLCLLVILGGCEARTVDPGRDLPLPLDHGLVDAPRMDADWAVPKDAAPDATYCTGWSSMGNLMEHQLNAVWGASANDVYAAGDYGNLFHYDGTQWSKEPVPATENLHDVWGTGADEVLVVGGPKTGFVLQYDGSAWTRKDLGDTPVNAVWASGPDDIYAVGGIGGPFILNGSGVLHHFDGTNWTTITDLTPFKPRPNFNLRAFVAVSGSSPADVWIVSENKALSPAVILHGSGSAWVPYTEQYSALRDIAGSGPNDVWAVGSYTWHYDGFKWKQHESAVGGSAVWVNGPNDVYVVGGRINHFDGVSWNEECKLSLHYLYDVWGTSGHLFVVGEGGTVLHKTL